MKRILLLATVAGRRLAADGVAFIGSRYARRLLVLSATLTAVMVVGVLGYATPSRADVDCFEGPNAHCLEKTASLDQVKVGEPLTFTISVFCVPGTICRNGFFFGVSDTLQAGLDFVRGSVTGGLDPNSHCSTLQVSTGTLVDCFPVTFDQDNPFVATIEVIPRQCGTFTNTAEGVGLSAPETFTVVRCPPPTKEQCKNGGWSDPAFAFPNQGKCESAVNRQNRQEMEVDPQRAGVL
jgi:uncharacterized repeat protein (TIGR01451 family)